MMNYWTINIAHDEPFAEHAEGNFDAASLNETQESVVITIDTKDGDPLVWMK